MIIRDDAQFRPTVDNCKETQVAVRRSILARPVREGEAIEDFIFEEQILGPSTVLEDSRPGRLDSTFQLLSLSPDHQFI